MAASTNLMDLPVELHLQIFQYLLSDTPTSYGYTHADRHHSWVRGAPRNTKLRRHGMLLANRQMSNSYRQAFYERTNFFFFIDANNGMRDSFWALSPALLPNLRQCKVYIEMAQLAKQPRFSLDVFMRRIKGLLGHMQQLRYVHLVWETKTGRTYDQRLQRFFDNPLLDMFGGLEEQWERLGEWSVELLKGKSLMRGMIVTVEDRIVRLEKKGMEWVEREVPLNGYVRRS